MRGGERERENRNRMRYRFGSVHAVMEEADDGNHNFTPWKLSAAVQWSQNTGSKRRVRHLEQECKI